jgi:hypothetical protein
VNIEKGYRALALIKERFGQHVDPDKAFELIDSTLRTGHATNVGLKQVICATAFDRGMLLGMIERAGDAAPGDPGDAFWEIRPYLELPTLADETPEVAAPDAKPRLIVP